ncbi:unnamed protein product [Heterobilharzia americana]|nr:unnamed protein product [Heterobilharzia americana]
MLRFGMKTLDEILSLLAPTELEPTVDSLIRRKDQCYLQKSKDRQTKMFERMLQQKSSLQSHHKGNKSNSIDISEVVVNLSDRNLFEYESSLHQKGPNFNLNKPCLSAFETTPTTEPALKSIACEAVNEVRYKISSKLLLQKSSTNNEDRFVINQ